jgi:hypothetical protein
MKSKRTKQVALTVFCFMFLAAPLVFLFSRSGASLGNDSMGQLYSSAVTLLGEWLARLLFCAVWLAADAALVWRMFLSKTKDNDVTSIEGLGD